MDYADRIVDLRRSRGLTQKELADSTSLSEIGVQSYERRRRKPAHDALISLADFFNVSIDYLVGRTDNPQIAKGGLNSMTQDESLGRYAKVNKVQKICLSDLYVEEKVNLMLQVGWKILDSYKVAYETDIRYVGGSTLYYILGHENPEAQIPLTERELEEQRRRED